MSIRCTGPLDWTQRRLCTRHRLHHVLLRVVCLPTQPSQPAESALSAEWHTCVCKATSVLRGIYTLRHASLDAAHGMKRKHRSMPLSTPFSRPHTAAGHAAKTSQGRKLCRYALIYHQHVSIWLCFDSYLPWSIGIGVLGSLNHNCWGWQVSGKAWWGWILLVVGIPYNTGDAWRAEYSMLCCPALLVSHVSLWSWQWSVGVGLVIAVHDGHRLKRG